MIAQALRLHETTIVRHIDDFINKDKLTPENGGSQPYLDHIQTDEVIAHILQQRKNLETRLMNFLVKHYPQSVIF